MSVFDLLELYIDTKKQCYKDLGFKRYGTYIKYILPNSLTGKLLLT